MKQLTQEIFNGMPKWVKSARIDAKGKLVVYSLEKSLVTRILNNEILLPWNCGIWDSGYDTTDWKNSAIDRVVIEVKPGYPCGDCGYHHEPHQCRTTFCEGCDALLS